MGQSRRRNVRRASAPPGGRAAALRRSVPPWRWGLTWVAVAVALGAVISVGVSHSRQAAYAAQLPSLPDLSNQPSAVREHLTEADRVARARPTVAEAVGALGLAYHADLFYDQAEHAYAIAEELSGFAWRWTYYRALVQGMRGNTDGLADGLGRVVAAAPDFGPAWWRLGDAEFKVGRYDRAGAAWRHALPLPEPARSADQPVSSAHTASAPVSAYAALGLARLAMVQGEAGRAGTMLEEVTATAPRFGPAFRLLGNAYMTLDRVEDGERALRIADRLPKYAPYLDPLTEALVQESRSTTFLLQQASTADLTTNAAWREYLVRRALEFDPDHLDALFDLATMFRVLLRYDEALELLERHRRLRPGNFQVLADIGRCLSGLRRYAEAEPVFRRALAGLDNADTRYDLGLVLDRVGQLAEAVVEYQRALDRDPNHLDALNNLGAALAGQGQLAAAAHLFERLVAVNPDDADARANLGVVLIASGAYDLATRRFREALRLEPDHARARAGLREIELR